MKKTLEGKRAFIAGVGDDQGYGWAIAKMLHYHGAEIYIGTWPPVLKIFKMGLSQGKFDESRKHDDGSMFEINEVVPLDALYDMASQVPSDVKENKRYKDLSNYTVSEVANHFNQNNISFDIVVHSLANGPEVKNPLLETSREGYLSAVSASAYSFVSLVQKFGPLMTEGGAFLNLTYGASETIVPGYGGGMSSAKAALESDTRTLAYEAGKKYKVRLNSISAGPLKSRAAKAIGFIEKMISYSRNNAPLEKDLEAEEVANAAFFLCSPLASAITASTIYVDNGLHAMGVSLDSACFND